MARTNKNPRGAKSQAIREYLSQHRRAKASEVITALATKGIKITPAAVYNLKARKRMGKRRRKAQANGQMVSLSLTSLLATKRLVDQVGGIEQARHAIDALAKLA